MFENTILIKEVTKEKNKLKFTYNDEQNEERTKTVFPDVPGYNLIAPNKMVKITVEKSDKGYWNVTKVDDIQQPAPQAPQKPIQSTTPAVQHPIATPDNKVRSVSVAYAKDLVVAGIIPLKDVYNQAHDFEAYMNGTFNPAYQADWMIK